MSNGKESIGFATATYQRGVEQKEPNSHSNFSGSLNKRLMFWGDRDPCEAVLDLVIRDVILQIESYLSSLDNSIEVYDITIPSVIITIDSDILINNQNLVIALRKAFVSLTNGYYRGLKVAKIFLVTNNKNEIKKNFLERNVHVCELPILNREEGPVNIVQQAIELNSSAVRFNVDWAMLVSGYDERKGDENFIVQSNDNVKAYLDKLIEAIKLAKSNNIGLTLVLFHFDLPINLFNGYSISENFPEYFSKFVKELLGILIKSEALPDYIYVTNEASETFVSATDLTGSWEGSAPETHPLTILRVMFFNSLANFLYNSFGYTSGNPENNHRLRRALEASVEGYLRAVNEIIKLDVETPYGPTISYNQFRAWNLNNPLSMLNAHILNSSFILNYFINNVYRINDRLKKELGGEYKVNKEDILKVLVIQIYGQFLVDWRGETTINPDPRLIKTLPDESHGFFGTNAWLTITDDFIAEIIKKVQKDLKILDKKGTTEVHIGEIGVSSLNEEQKYKYMETIIKKIIKEFRLAEINLEQILIWSPQIQPDDRIIPENELGIWYTNFSFTFDYLRRLLNGISNEEI